MNITKIRDNEKSLPKETLEMVCGALDAAISHAGFKTDVRVVNKSRIDLSGNRCSFKVDVERLGYNARYAPGQGGNKGYTRTSTPTWHQRVEYNNIVNKVLNRYGLSANVTSGGFTIRSGMESKTESDWISQTPEWIRINEARGYIVTGLPVQLTRLRLA